MGVHLEVSTSSRSTWVWAPDEHGVAAVLAVLAAAGQCGTRIRGGPGQFRVVDVDIGVAALGALGALVDAGHTFAWHSSQHRANRLPQLYGIDIDPPASSPTR